MSAFVAIRRVRDADRAEWLRMVRSLLPGHAPEEYEAGMRRALARADAAVFVADRGDGRLAGYVEVGLRPYADGCDTSPVGYLEEWWVDADVRHRGVGGRLVEAAERWARERGCREMASDALLDNVGSQRAHERLGYAEVERAVHYRKALDGALDDGRDRGPTGGG